MFQESRPALDRLELQLERHPAEEIWTTIVSFQEQVGGWLAYLNRTRKDEQILRAYRELMDLQKNFADMQILPFTQPALSRFKVLRKQLRTIGTMDLRIACIALVLNATLVTRNLKDFRDVPGLMVEDWTQ